MELHRYDIIEAELDYGSGSIQKKRRPYIIVSNEKGTTNATIITVMPLTSAKKKRLPEWSRPLPYSSAVKQKASNG